MRERTQVADRYELGAPLGRGSMGEVWEGYDRRLDRPVAVKLIRPAGSLDDADQQRLVNRFRREARATARLDHAGVPTLYDAGVEAGVPFLVMQLVSGTNLSDLVAERGPLPVSWAAAAGAQICSVLAAAHAASLVHRDLKPRNLMLCPDGSVKVLDFGIAVMLDAADQLRLTTTGQTPGTPAYMSPEQASGDEVGPPADLYALGCVLFKLFTGTPPFTADLPVAVVNHHLHSNPPPLRPARPDVPAPLAALVGELLGKRPEQRPAGAAEVYHRLMPYATAAAGESVATARALGPTLPYHYPYGPLPSCPASS